MPLQGLDNVKKMIAANKKKRNLDLRGVYFSGLRAIIKQTPVDEGRARNNWFLTVGMPSGLVGRADNQGGNDSYVSISKMPPYILNKKVYFTNNLPYIETLEYGGYPNPNKGKRTTGGFSNQAPGGWARGTLIAMQTKVKEL